MRLRTSAMQDAVIERVAGEYGGVKVVPLPDLTNFLTEPMHCDEHPVAVCGHSSDLSHVGEWRVVDYSGSETMLDVYEDES